MAELTQEQERERERLRAIKDRVADEFLRRPGVTGVGVGFKEVGGHETDLMAIRFYVARKRAVPEGEALPREIEGAPTDVIEAEFRPAVQSLPDKEKYDPLVGGISLAPSRKKDSVGTLGVMVADLLTGDPMMLSNFHVMCGKDGGYEVGDEMCQPARVDTLLGWCSNCAKLDRWFVGNVQIAGKDYGIDAAVATLTHRDATIGGVVDIGTLRGVTEAKERMEVEKRGRTTGLTTGTVTDISLKSQSDFGPPWGVVALDNQILVKGAMGPFLQGGDSGSLLVATTTQWPVGLCWAEDPRSAGNGVACSISAVLGALNVGL